MRRRELCKNHKTSLLTTLIAFGLFSGVNVQANSNVQIPLAVKTAVEAFKEGPSGYEIPKSISEKYFDLDEGRIHAGFAHNLFYLNHLNPNFSTRPKYVTNIITETITTIIPGKIIPGGIIGYRDVITGYETVVTGYEDVIVGYNDVITGYNDVIVGYEDKVVGYNDVIVGYEPDKEVITYGDWGNWTTTNSNLNVDIPGEKTGD